MRRELNVNQFERKKTQLKKLRLNLMTIKKIIEALTSLIHPCNTNNALVCQFLSISFEKSAKMETKLLRLCERKSR